MRTTKPGGPVFENRQKGQKLKVCKNQDRAGPRLRQNNAEYKNIKIIDLLYH